MRKPCHSRSRSDLLWMTSRITISVLFIGPVPQWWIKSVVPYQHNKCCYNITVFVAHFVAFYAPLIRIMPTAQNHRTISIFCVFCWKCFHTVLNTRPNSVFSIHAISTKWHLVLLTRLGLVFCWDMNSVGYGFRLWSSLFCSKDIDNREVQQHTSFFFSSLTMVCTVFQLLPPCHSAQVPSLTYLINF